MVFDKDLLNIWVIVGVIIVEIKYRNGYVYYGKNIEFEVYFIYISLSIN